MLASFNANALSLFDEDARSRGAIDAEDRHGVTRFLKCTRLSIGAVPLRAGTFTRTEQVASAAASAKHEDKAKSSPRGLDVQGC